MLGNGWEPVGENDPSRLAAGRALAGTIAMLTTGQYLVVETQPLGVESIDTLWVGVAHYGHNLHLIQVPGATMLPDALRLPPEAEAALADMGFAAPTLADELVGHPEAWQLPFGHHDAVEAAEMVIWVQEVIYRLPHPLLLSRAHGGNFIEGAPVPCLHLLNEHSLAA